MLPARELASPKAMTEGCLAVIRPFTTPHTITIISKVGNVTKPQATKKASPWGEVPSLSRRRGVMTIKRKNCSPLSVALTGASSPLGEPFSAYTASGNQAFQEGSQPPKITLL